jgi:hypothetical protein
MHPGHFQNANFPRPFQPIEGVTPKMNPPYWTSKAAGTGYPASDDTINGTPQNGWDTVIVDHPAARTYSQTAYGDALPSPSEDAKASNKAS